MERERKTRLFAGIMAFVVGVSVFVGYLLFWYFVLGDRKPVFPMNYLQKLGDWYCVAFLIGCAAVLALSFAHWSQTFFGWLARRFTAEVPVPVLYRCDNNGVAVLITADQREQAFKRMVAAGGNIMLVPDAMVFTADDHFYPMRLDVIRTGNWVDMRNLIEGCTVKSDSIHVNFSSFNMVDKEYQWANFCPPKLDDAIRWVEREKTRLARAAWLRQNTFYAALFGFALTVLAFVLGMIATFALTKTILFICSGGSLVIALWAVRRLNSLSIQ